jgi:hypothetical protein
MAECKHSSNCKLYDECSLRYPVQGGAPPCAGTVVENFTPTNKASPKLPADIVESFHNILHDNCGLLWSNERHVMDIVAAFISR